MPAAVHFLSQSGPRPITEDNVLFISFNSSCSAGVNRVSLIMLRRCRNQAGSKAVWLILVTAICAELVSGDVNLAFPSFNNTLLDCIGSCQFASNSSSAFLTPNPFDGTYPEEGLGGRLMYKNAIQFYDAKSGKSASFRAFFVVSLVNSTNPRFPNAYLGDGMAFLIAPNTTLPSIFGGGLGLFSSNDTGGPVDGSDSEIVAVEIDTFGNNHDLTHIPHVGIDVNSVASDSSNSVPILSGVSESFMVHKNISVWVEYDAPSQTLEVVVSISGFQENTTLSYPGLKLWERVREFSYIGFSAATGQGAEVVTILSWTFSTSGLGPTAAVASKRSNTRHRIGLVIGLVLLVAAAVLVGYFCLIRRWQKRLPPPPPLESLRYDGLQIPDLGGPKEYSYSQLKQATSGFSDATFLGKGGFGNVHKGILDGTVVAIKRVAADSRQGAREFVAEVNTIGRLRHKNLVPLKGWSHSDGELLLVYEYMENLSLDKYLFSQKGDDAATTILDWRQRFHILQGVAAALLYLHEDWEGRTVVHRDIKSSNILLDAAWNPRLGDFGLARVVEQNHAETVTQVAGTREYMAPECPYTGRVSAESDVYSFGVVALEVACGRRPVDWSKDPIERVLINWVWHLHRAGTLLNAADPQLEGRYDSQQMASVLVVGLLCTLEEPSHRPTIRQVTQCFSGNNVTTVLPSLPASKPASLYGPNPSSEKVPSISSLITSSNSGSGTSSPTTGTQSSSTDASVPESMAAQCEAR